MNAVGGWPTAPTPQANPHLYVHNVPKDSNEEELRSVFGRYGTVANVRLKVNQKVGPHAVYAFVTFTSTEEARNALNNLHGKTLRGRALRIEFQRAAASPQPTNVDSMAVQRPMYEIDESPPSKRMRGISEQTVKYVASNDQAGLIEAMKELLAAQRPDLMDSFMALCEHWMTTKGNLAPASITGTEQTAVWPPSQLSTVQQKLATEGNLELDKETGRWGVMLNRLISTAAAAAAAASEDDVTTPPASAPPSAPTVTAASGVQPALWEEKLSALAPCTASSTPWTGVMSRNEKRVLRVVMTVKAGELPPILTAVPSLSITLRSPYDEMLKKNFIGFAELQLAAPGEPSDRAQLQDYINYFETKNRAGVAKLSENVYAYIFPTSTFSAPSTDTLHVVFGSSADTF